MKKSIFIAVAVVATVLLVGCKEDDKSAQWWLAHPKEATEKYIECKKTGEVSVNCENINQVKKRIAIGYEPMREAIDR